MGMKQFFLLQAPPSESDNTNVWSTLLNAAMHIIFVELV